MGDKPLERPKKYILETITNGPPVAAPVPATQLKGLLRTFVRHRKLIVIISLLLVVTISVSGIFYMATRENKNELPRSITNSSIGFKLYYFKNNNLPDGFSLNKQSISLTNDTLVFSLVNPQGYVVGITEQNLPTDFTNSVLQGTDSVDTANGKAAISSIKGGRTTASLVTKDKTFILLNTNDPVELTAIKDIIRSLAPLP